MKVCKILLLIFLLWISSLTTSQELNIESFKELHSLARRTDEKVDVLWLLIRQGLSYSQIDNIDNIRDNVSKFELSLPEWVELFTNTIPEFNSEDYDNSKQILRAINFTSSIYPDRKIEDILLMIHKLGLDVFKDVWILRRDFLQQHYLATKIFNDVNTVPESLIMKMIDNSKNQYTLSKIQAFELAKVFDLVDYGLANRWNSPQYLINELINEYDRAREQCSTQYFDCKDGWFSWNCLVQEDQCYANIDKQHTKKVDEHNKFVEQNDGVFQVREGIEPASIYHTDGPLFVTFNNLEESKDKKTE